MRMKQAELGACVDYERRKTFTKLYYVNVKGRSYLEDVSIN
jgi:hypothetical protein